MEKKLPKISVVIPSYNKGKYIKQTLDSVFSQKYPSLEVLVQDGGSTDKTVEIINSFQKKYPQELFFESKEDKGQTDAINVGIKKAKGDIVTYLNADDYYEGNALWKVANYFMHNPKINWAAGYGQMVSDKGKVVAGFFELGKRTMQYLNNRNLLLVGNYLYQPSVFFRRKFLQKMGEFVGVDGIILEYDMWLKMAKLEMHGNIPAKLSAFRLASGGFSAQHSQKILAAELAVAEKYTSDPAIILLHKFVNWSRKLVSNIYKAK